MPDLDDLSIATATRWWLRALAAGLALLVLALILGLVGWLAGWWFKAQNTERQAQVNESSYGRQESLRTEVGKNIGVVFDITSQIQLAPDDTARQVLSAQRLNTVSMVCRDAAKIDDKSSLDPEQLDFIDMNCVGAAVAQTSEYRP